MANQTLKLFLTVLAVFLLASKNNSHSCMAMAHPFGRHQPITSSTTLAARLKLDADNENCWDSLTQLQACTSEIVLFFLNGETQLGPGCCLAIRTITNHCWPNMIDILGFTTEEGDVLEGYCEKSTGVSPPPPSLLDFENNED